MMLDSHYAQAYWFAKMKMGYIGEETSTAVLKATVDMAALCAKAFAVAGRRDDAEAALELLEKLCGVGKVAPLREELLR